MNKRQRGIVIFPVLVILVLLGIVGYLVYRDSQRRTTPPPPISIPKSGQIAWNEVEKLFEDCQVTEIMQTHSLEVTLKLKNGSTKTTIEPKIDEVFRLHSEVAADCDHDIILGTE